MLFGDSYYTVAGPSEGLYKDKGSKFLAYLMPVANESDIKAALLQLRKEHPSARHHCYAWRLGPDAEASRANDDGEPSGTAGKPILNQLKSAALTNVLLVVVRYFGGTLLGVNGLIQAYKSAAVDAIDKASKLEKFIEYGYTLRFDAADSSQVMRVLKDLDAKIISNSYDTRSVLEFDIKKRFADQLEERIKELYTTELTYGHTHRYEKK